MFKLKYGLFVLLTAFLAACGSQADLPEAVPNDTPLSSIGSINEAELEQAFETGTLTPQTSWNKSKFNKFVLEKKVEGPGPEHQKYPVAVVCKVPYSSSLLYVAGAKKLTAGEKTYFYVPKKYVKCAALEFEVFGDDGVHFKYEQGYYKANSNVKYAGKLLIWGKKFDYKASEFFHVKDGKHYGEARFTVINKYKEPEPEPQKLIINVLKRFTLSNALPLPDGTAPMGIKPEDVKIALVCEGQDPIPFTLGADFRANNVEAYVLPGSKCVVTEDLHLSDKYKVDAVRFDARNPKDNSAVNTTDNDAPYMSGPFYIVEHQERLNITVNNFLKQKLVVKLIKKLTQADKHDHHYAYHPDANDFKITLDCGVNTDYTFTDLAYHKADTYNPDRFVGTATLYTYRDDTCKAVEEWRGESYEPKAVNFYITKNDDLASFNQDLTEPYESNPISLRNSTETLTLDINNFLLRKYVH